MRLSDFRDEAAIRVIADLLPYIGDIGRDASIAGAAKEGNMAFASALLRAKPKATMAILAILDGKAPEDYHCTAASVLKNIMEMLTDPEMLALFGLQGKTAALSGSASTTGGDTEEPQDSSGT